MCADDAARHRSPKRSSKVHVSTQFWFRPLVAQAFAVAISQANGAANQAHTSAQAQALAKQLLPKPLQQPDIPRQHSKNYRWQWWVPAQYSYFMVQTYKAAVLLTVVGPCFVMCLLPWAYKGQEPPCCSSCLACLQTCPLVNMPTVHGDAPAAAAPCLGFRLQPPWLHVQTELDRRGDAGPSGPPVCWRPFPTCLCTTQQPGLTRVSCASCRLLISWTSTTDGSNVLGVCSGTLVKPNMLVTAGQYDLWSPCCLLLPC